MPGSSSASSSPGGGWRPRRRLAGPPISRVRRPVGLVPVGRLQGPRRRGAARGALSRPRRGPPAQPRDLPPALCDEHPPRVAARPAVPGDRPQRRDQHDPDEPRAGPRPNGRSARRPGLGGPPARRGRARSCRPTAPTPSRSTRRSSCSSRRAGASRSHSSRSSPKRRRCATAGHPLAGAFARRTAGFLAPWDGPAALVFGDGRRVGALVDRNGLRPLAFAVTRERLVAAASEAGAVPIEPAETVRRGRLGPGEMLLVDPRRGAILEDVEAKTEILRRSWRPDAPRSAFADAQASGPVRGVERRGGDRPPTGTVRPRPRAVRHLAGLDAERRQARHPDDGRRSARSRSGAWATTRRRRPGRGSTGRSPTTSARRSPRSPTRRSTPSASAR